MTDSRKLVEVLESRGYYVNDDRMEQVKDFAENLLYIEKRNGNWTREDAQMAQGFAQSLRELADRGFWLWSKEDAQIASEYRKNVEWLADKGRYSWFAKDVAQASEFVSNLRLLAVWGEEATTERMEDVAEFVANLKLMRRQ